MLPHTPAKAPATLLIRGARQLLTLRGPKEPRRGSQLADLGVIRDGALLIQDGVIVEAGPARRLENISASRGATEIAADGRIVLPGFIDPHTHLLWPPAGAEGGDPTRADWFIHAATGQRIESRARPLLETLARHGATTVEIKTGYGPEENPEAKLLRVLAALGAGPIEIASTFLLRLPEQERAQAVETAINILLPRVRRSRLARFADFLWDGPELAGSLHLYLHTAQALGFRLKVHADGPQPAAAIVQAVAHKAVSVDHLEHAGVEEADLLAQTSTMATLLPAAAFRRGTPMPPARAFLDAGVAIAIGSNFNPHESPIFSMQAAIALAVREMGLTPEEAISAATINAAHALDMADGVGSLERGKLADLLLLNVSDYRELPAAFGGNLVHLTMRRGAVIYREGAVGPGAAVAE